MLGLLSGALGGLGCFLFYDFWSVLRAHEAGIWTGVVVSGARGWWMGPMGVSQGTACPSPPGQLGTVERQQPKKHSVPEANPLSADQKIK